MNKCSEYIVQQMYMFQIVCFVVCGQTMWTCRKSCLYIWFFLSSILLFLNINNVDYTRLESRLNNRTPVELDIRGTGWSYDTACTRQLICTLNPSQATDLIKQHWAIWNVIPIPTCLCLYSFNLHICIYNMICNLVAQLCTLIIATINNYVRTKVFFIH